uniref:Secreted protein n=1 Tax=Heterorhabditis bacteriophora TaxID=37862 RepID=A0A1I7WHI3_HETBA
MCPMWARRPPILFRNYLSYFLIFVLLSNCVTRGKESCSEATIHFMFGSFCLTGISFYTSTPFLLTSIEKSGNLLHKH